MKLFLKNIKYKNNIKESEKFITNYKTNLDYEKILENNAIEKNKDLLSLKVNEKLLNCIFKST